MSDAPNFRRLVGRLKLRHFELLDLLGMDPNVGRAAKRMNTAQSTASKLLKEIEGIFGAPMFLRNRRGLSPTTAGIAMTRRAGIVLQELRAMHGEYLVTLQGSTGRLRLGVFPVAVPELLPVMRRKLLELLPGIVLSVEEGAEYTLLAALSAGQIDCILGRVVAERLTPDLQHVVLYREPTVIVCGVGHPIVRTRKLQILQVLGNSDWLLPSSGGASHNMVSTRLALEGIPSPRVVLESISVFVTIELLTQNQLLSVLPEKVARAYAKVGKLAIVPIDLLASNYPVGIIFRQDSADKPLIQTAVTAAAAAAQLAV